MIPARATCMIQVAAQVLRTSVMSAASLARRPLCNSGARRMPISAARSARVICGACSMARYSAGSRASAYLDRLVGPAGPGRVACARNSLLDVAELEHLDPLGKVGQRRIGGKRGAERRQRIALAVEREQRLTAAEERRHVGMIASELERAIE